MISIGWIPLNQFGYYNKFTSVHELKHEGYRLLNQFYGYGLQAYIVRKKDILQFPSILIKQTYDDYLKSVKSQKFPNVEDSPHIMLADWIIPRVLGQISLSPPVAIETYVPSDLDHNNILIWKNYFSGKEDLVRQYYGHEHDSGITNANFYESKLV